MSADIPVDEKFFTDQIKEITVSSLERTVFPYKAHSMAFQGGMVTLQMLPGRPIDLNKNERVSVAFVKQNTVHRFKALVQTYGVRGPLKLVALPASEIEEVKKREHQRIDCQIQVYIAERVEIRGRWGTKVEESATIQNISGAGVLVRQWLTQQGVASPSAALIKAILLNTTHAMAPGQYGTGSTQEIPFDRPNTVSGWGRLDLSFIDATAPYTLWWDDHTTGLQTGQAVSYTHGFSRPLTIITGAQPLRVMLAWTDPPASLSASSQLVNDLDLVAIGPGGTRYYGNDVTSGDRTNNMEGIVVDNPPVGQYRLEVSAHNVPVDSQPYALVVAGPFQDMSQSPVTVSRTNILTGTWHIFTDTCAQVWFTDTGHPPVTAVTVTLSDDYPSIDGQGLPRRYDIEADGSGFQAMLSLCYADSELTDAGIDSTQEADLHAYRYDVSSADWITYSLVNTITNQVTATLVTEFGVWGLGVAGDRPTVVTLQTLRMRPENLLTLLLIGPGVSLGLWVPTWRRKRR